jgi:hypothetical protein
MKVDKKALFHVLDLTIVNGYILLSACSGKKISHIDFGHPYQRDADKGWA